MSNHQPKGVSFMIILRREPCLAFICNIAVDKPPILPKNKSPSISPRVSCGFPENKSAWPLHQSFHGNPEVQTRPKEKQPNDDVMVASKSI